MTSRLPAVFALVVGVLMIAQWSVTLATGRMPELQATPLAAVAHLAAEFLTAFALIAAGIGLLRRRSWARTVGLVSAGGLVYAVVQASGYMAQVGEWPAVAMFAVLLAGGLLYARAVARATP